MGSDDGGGGLSPSPSPSRPPLAPFPLLADPRSYRANTFDYMAGWVAPAGAGAASHSGPATAAAAPSSQQGQGHEGDAAPPVGAAAAVTYRQWVEVFRKSIPTYRAHAARDQGPGACGGGDGMTDEERQVGLTARHGCCRGALRGPAGGAWAAQTARVPPLPCAGWGREDWVRCLEESRPLSHRYHQHTSTPTAACTQVTQ